MRPPRKDRISGRRRPPLERDGEPRRRSTRRLRVTEQRRDNTPLIAGLCLGGAVLLFFLFLIIMRTSNPPQVVRPPERGEKAARTVKVVRGADQSTQAAAPSEDPREPARPDPGLSLADVRAAAARGEDGISELVRAFDSRDSAVAEEAAASLAKLGKTGLPHLIKGLTVPNARVRGYVAKTLGSMGKILKGMDKESGDVIAALEATAEGDKRVDVRQIAEKALRRIRDDLWD